MGRLTPRHRNLVHVMGQTETEQGHVALFIMASASSCSQTQSPPGKRSVSIEGHIDLLANGDLVGVWVPD